ncbi:MAG: FtsW/RodA/SpoVE family cell cycle protein, partial [Oscillospiraceae bacterium]
RMFFVKHFLRRCADYIRECDKLFMILCVFTASYGCVAVLSATYSTGSLRQFFMQFFCMILGIIAVVVISNFNYKDIVKLWPIIAIVGVIPVILTFFIGYAPGQTDDKAWLQLPGGITFQPAELLKIVFVITFSCHVNKLGDKIHKLRHILLLCIHGAIPVLLIHFQGDDGTALIFAFMFVGMMFIAGIKIRYFAIAGAAAAAALPIVFFFVMNEDQRSRIISLFFPKQEDYLGVLWQQWRGRIAFANGGIWGKGFLNGPYVQSGSVPEGHNDFIIASIGEEFGMLGCIVVLLLISAICIRMLRIGQLSGDKTGLVICGGVFSMFLAQTLVNVGMCLSLMPVIGVTLPLFSAGGTSLICLFLGIGLVMSVYMHRSSGPFHLGDE